MFPPYRGAGHRHLQFPVPGSQPLLGWDCRNLSPDIPRFPFPPFPIISGSQAERGSTGSWVRRMAQRARAMARRKEVAASFSSEDEGSDEAPEEVTFERARMAAEEARRLAGERARREKSALKEKRRQREELFKEQKKKKLLPENVLEELTSSAQDSNNKPSDTAEEDQNTEDEEDESESKESVLEDNEEETLAVRLQQSYMAVRLKDQDLADKQQQAAKDFIRRHLYGNGSNRTTANKYFSLENKKATVKKAAIQFVVNTWGKKKKKKAKQFTKRWITSKMAPKT